MSAPEQIDLPNSFLGLQLAPRTTGSAIEIVGTQLLPMGSRTSKLSLLLPRFTFEAAAKLTWGLSGLDLSKTKIEIFIGSFDSIIEKPTGHATKTRCGWLRHLLEDGRLQVAPLPEGVSTIEMAIWWDNTNQPISVSTKHQISADDNTAHYEVWLDWNWGNPIQTLRKQAKALNRTLERDEAASELKGALQTALQYVISTPPPYEEIFDESVSESELVPGYVLRGYQEEAIQNWVKNEHRGIFAMCTGSGKTVAAFGAVMTLCRTLSTTKNDLPFVIVTVPKKILADQWVSEIESIFDQAALKAYGSVRHWQPTIDAYTRSKPSDFPRFIVTTYCTLISTAFRESLSRAHRSGRSAILIADESHNVSSASIREAFTELSGLLQWRLALSATPLIEKNETANRFILTYFSEEMSNLDAETEEAEKFCGAYTLADGINGDVLCRYDYYPLPMFLDPKTGSDYLRVLKAIDENSTDIELYSRRREIIQKSHLPIEALKNLLHKKRAECVAMNHTLVYCQPGNVRESVEDTDEDENATEPVIKNLLQETIEIIHDSGLETKVIIGGTSEGDRKRFLQEFRNGEVDCLCAIGCLDEGVDIPSIERAIVLYSLDRERQFVQRRGRILRKDKGNQNKRAAIYDVILLPHHSLLSDSQAQRLLAKEMRRYREFAVLAENRTEAETIINHALAATVS